MRSCHLGFLYWDMISNVNRRRRRRMTHDCVFLWWARNGVLLTPVDISATKLFSVLYLFQAGPWTWPCCPMSCLRRSQVVSLFLHQERFTNYIQHHQVCTKHRWVPQGLVLIAVLLIPVYTLCEISRFNQRKLNIFHGI